MTNPPSATAKGDRYKYVALANTTAAMFMATLDGSIVIIALPAIFRGIHLDPLAPGSISYLLWMIMGYRLVQAVLVVNVGRLGDKFGRVPDLQRRLRRVHGRLDPAVVRPVRRRPRGDVADRLAGSAGRRRVDADGELGRDPDRCLPGRPARFRAGHQPDRRPGRHVRRPCRGRPARGHRLACGVLGERAGRHLRDGVGQAIPRVGAFSTTDLDEEGTPRAGRLRDQAPRAWPSALAAGWEGSRERLGDQMRTGGVAG